MLSGGPNPAARAPIPLHATSFCNVSPKINGGIALLRIRTSTLNIYEVALGKVPLRLRPGAQWTIGRAMLACPYRSGETAMAALLHHLAKLDIPGGGQVVAEGDYAFVGHM